MTEMTLFGPLDYTPPAPEIEHDIALDDFFVPFAEDVVPELKEVCEAYDTALARAKRYERETGHKIPAPPEAPEAVATLRDLSRGRVIHHNGDLYANGTRYTESDCFSRWIGSPFPSYGGRMWDVTRTALKWAEFSCLEITALPDTLDIEVRMREVQLVDATSEAQKMLDVIGAGPDWTLIDLLEAHIAYGGWHIHDDIMEVWEHFPDEGIVRGPEGEMSEDAFDEHLRDLMRKTATYTVEGL